ncbi:MAG TPA: tetratricopeptide repeat protein [Candidatus Binatia bacterium]
MRARARELRATRALRAVQVRLLVLCGGLSVLGACALVSGSVHRSLEVVAGGRDALATSDALEALIAEGKDTPADRRYAYDAVRKYEEDTPGYTYARAVVTGRLVQQEGLVGAGKVPDVERYARRSRELDPEFRDGAATRVLGTLYVVAPANLLAHGDSEEGLALLEGLVQRHPETAANHLRLAEAYVALGDPEPAGSHLCLLLSRRGDLHPDEQILLDQLVREVGGAPCASPG